MAADPEPSPHATPPPRSPAGRSGLAFSSLLVASLLAGLALVHWQIVVLEPALAMARASDLFKESMPTVIAGVGAWREGRLALWNPDQLAGLPFMAVPYSGLLYPGNLWLLLSDDLALAVDATQIAHLVFAGLCMVWLVRALAMGWAPAIAAALTFMFSGWMGSLAGFPVLVQGMAWLPASVVAVERTLCGKRLAPIALALVVAMQILNGATEYLVYNLYAAGLYALFGVAPRLRDRAASSVLAPLGLLALSVGLGAALAGAQLLPSLELVSQSARSDGVSQGEALFRGTLPLAEFARLSATTAGVVSVGTLPMLGLLLGLGATASRRRALWLYALLLLVVSTLLAAGGAFFELYFDTPFGQLFRRPNKLLHLFSFAAALFAALGLARLEAWREEGAGSAALLRSPAWLCALSVVGAICAWVAWQESPNAPLVSSLIALLLFGLLPKRSARALAITALLLFHGWDLFLTKRPLPERPSAQLQLLHRESALFDWLDERRGDARVHLSNEFRKDHGLTLKQGMLRGIPVLMDKQPLAMARHTRFLELVSGGNAVREGYVSLLPTARLDLLDLASVRFYVLKPGAPFEKALAKRARRADGGVRRVRTTRRFRVYEREGWLPRAYAVPEARTLASPRQVLAALQLADFDARREVLLEAAEEQTEETPELAGPLRPLVASVRIVGEEPERLVIEAELDRPGHLVVSDSWYPGWRASVNGASVPIRRANYLFRSVPLPAGASRVVFEYAPASFRLGAIVSALAALALAALAVGRRAPR